MPNKYSHRVVLAHYSSLGLVDLPNDTELLDYADLSYSAYASRSKRNSRPESNPAPSRVQVRAPSRPSVQAYFAKAHSSPSHASDSQYRRISSSVENSIVKLPQEQLRTSPYHLKDPKTPRQRASPVRIYLSDDDDLEFAPLEGSIPTEGKKVSIFHNAERQRPLPSQSVWSDRNSLASSLGFDLPTDSTLIMESQSAHHTTGPSSNESASQAASGSIWSNSEQSHTPLTSPMRSGSRSPRESVTSSSRCQSPYDSTDRDRSKYASSRREELPHARAAEVSFTRDSSSRKSPLPHSQVISDQEADDKLLYPDSLRFEKPNLLPKKTHSNEKIVRSQGLTHKGNFQLDSPTLNPEMEFQEEDSKGLTTYQHLSRTASEYSTNTQVFRPLPTQPDFDDFGLNEDMLDSHEPVGVKSATCSYDCLPADQNTRSQALDSEQVPKDHSSDKGANVKRPKSTLAQVSSGSILKSYSSYSSLSSLGDFIPSPLLPERSFQKQMDERPPQSLHHTASVPSLPNAAFSPSIFEGFEPRARDDSVPPLPRINLLSYPAARRDPETASLSSNALFPPDIPTTRRPNSNRLSAQAAAPITSAPAAVRESEAQDLAKAIAEAELKVKTLKQEAAKGSLGKKSGNRLMKKFLNRGKLGD